MASHLFGECTVDSLVEIDFCMQSLILWWSLCSRVNVWLLRCMLLSWIAPSRACGEAWACLVDEFVCSSILLLQGTRYTSDYLSGLTATYSHHFVMTANCYCSLLSTTGDWLFSSERNYTVTDPQVQRPQPLLVFTDFEVAAPYESLPHLQWCAPSSFSVLPFLQCCSAWIKFICFLLTSGYFSKYCFSHFKRFGEAQAFVDPTISIQWLSLHSHWANSARKIFFEKMVTFT